MNKFKNKYRIPSARLPHWDYRWAGAYFITICTQNRIYYFGEITNDNMQYSPVGAIADVLWYEIPHYAKNVELGAFVVMPNHIHGILILHNENIADTTDNVDNADNVDDVETLHATSLPPQPPQTQHQTNHKNKQMSKISPKPNSISTIIRSYKSAVTKHAHRLGFDFQWQSRFYDHIIRDDAAFQKISNYIVNNPSNWKEDKFFNQ